MGWLSTLHTCQGIVTGIKKIINTNLYPDTLNYGLCFANVTHLGHYINIVLYMLTQTHTGCPKKNRT